MILDLEAKVAILTGLSEEQARLSEEQARLLNELRSKWWPLYFLLLIHFLMLKLAQVNSFTPATPVAVMTAQNVRVMEPRFRLKPKRKRYAEQFDADVRRFGYRAEIVHNNFMVYKEGHARGYQCEATHENVLRAYTAFKLNCLGNIDQFFEMGPLTDDNVPVLPLSAEDGDLFR